MLFAYKRVSTVGQNTDRQLVDAGVKFDKIFTDKASAKDTNRPRLKALLETVRKGDEIHVHSLDRLARNVTDIKNIVSSLNEQGVGVVFHKEGLSCKPDENSITGNLILNVLGAVAEFEREIINERIREGVAVAKAKGKYKGRTANMRKAEEIKKLDATGDYTREEIAEKVGCGVATVYRTLKKPA